MVSMKKENIPEHIRNRECKRKKWINYEGRISKKKKKKVIQYIQAKISKTLDSVSTLIFAANCTDQKLSSSERYYYNPHL